MVPFDSRSALLTSGIRIGTAAMTTRGCNEEDFIQMAVWVDEAISNGGNDQKLKSIKVEVNKFMERFPLYPS